MERIYLQERHTASFGIASDEAFVASAEMACLNCQKNIDVICIYGASGVDSENGDFLSQFTVSNVWAVDAALAGQLGAWPSFRKEIGGDSEAGVFANFCPHCGAMQEDYLLHSEPGDVFFGIAQGMPGLVKFTRLDGRIQLSGDYGFQV